MPAIVPAIWSAVPDPIPFAGGTLNGDPPRGVTAARIGTALNYGAGRGRVLFSQHIELANSPSLAGVTDLYRLSYFDRNNNGHTLKYAAIYAPKDSALGTAVAVLRDSATDLLTIGYLDAAPAAPSKLAWGISAINGITASGAELQRLIRVVDGFRLISLTIWEQPDESPLFRLSGTDHHVDVTQYMAGGPIVTAAITDLRETTDELWNRIRDVYNYCSHKMTAAEGYSTTSTTYVNVIDNSAPPRTASTPGIPVSALSGGKGLATSVKAHYGVYAQASGGAGTGAVQFASSIGTSGALTIPNGAAGWVMAATNDLLIDTRSANADGRDWDKVDPQFKVTDAATTLRVWAWHVEIEP